MLKNLFSSQTRVKLLNFFLSHPEERFFVREIVRKTGEQLNSIRRELQNLETIGFLHTAPHLNRKYYEVNTEFLLYPELRSIVNKTALLESDFTEKLGKMGEVYLVVLGGQFVGDKKGNVDLLVVGDVAQDKIKKLLDGHALGGVEGVRYTFLTTEDFTYRIQCHDKFVLDILRNPANILSLNRLPKNLKTLVSL